MSNLNLNFMKACCDDKWLASTYSEYLMHCAKDKTNLLNSITEIMSDPDLEDDIDLHIDSVNILTSRIDKAVGENLRDGGYNPFEVVKTDPLYHDAFIEALSDPYFGDILDEFNEELDENFSTLEELYSYYCICDTPEKLVYKSQAYDTAISSLISTKLAALGYNNETAYSLNDGFVNLKDMIRKLVDNANFQLSGDQIRLAAKDSQDNVIPTITLSDDQIWDELKNSLSSTIAWAQGFAACGLDTISDRVNQYESLVKGMIADTTANFASTVSTVRSMLADKQCSVRNFIDQATDLLGWNELTSDNIVLSETKISDYTGASPLSDLNLNTAKGIAVATGRTICAAGAAIWNGIKSLAKKVWSKIRPTVMSVTNNPFDLEKIDSAATSYTADGWCYNFTSKVMFDQTGLDSAVINNYVAGLTKNKGEWTKIENIFGEVLFRVNSAAANMTIIHPNLTQHYGLLVEYDIQLKPKCMKKSTVLNYLATGTQDSYQLLEIWAGRTIDDLTSAINSFKNSNDMYADVEDGEYECFLGFILGVELLLRSNVISTREAIQNLEDNNVQHLSNYCTKFGTSGWSALNYNAENQLYIPNSTISVSNLDFIKVISGYKSINSEDTFRTTYIPVDNSGSIQISEGYYDVLNYFGPRYLYLMMEVWRDKIENPLDYCYYPYSSNYILFNDPRFKIKTDADNVNVANAFFNALVVIAVIAISVIVVGSVVKIAKAKRKARIARQVGMMDNAMWNGKKLSTFEALRYSRKTNKLNKLSSAVSGLNAGSNVTEKISQVSSQISQSLLASNSSVSKQRSPVDNGLLISSTLTDSEKLDRIYYMINKGQFSFS